MFWAMDDNTLEWLDVLGKVLMQTGDVTISGDQALNDVRARHVKSDVAKSDYDRIKRQQAFIGALLKKVMSSDVVSLDCDRILSTCSRRMAVSK